MGEVDEKQLKESIASIMKDKAQRDSLAEMIVEYVQPEHIATDFVSMLLDTRNLKPGDLLVKKIRRNNAKVHTLVPGAIHLKEEITVQDRINWVLDGIQIGVTANLWELQSGQIGTVDEIRTELMAKIRDFYINKVFTALSTIWTASNTPDNYTSVGGNITATALKNAINKVNLNTPGGARAIVGTRSTLTPITEFGAFWNDGTNNFAVPSRIEEVARTGFLGSYMGVPLVVLPQQYDAPDTHTKLLPEDKILVIGQKVGEFITYGTPQSQQWDEMRTIPPYWNLDIYQQFGLIIDNADGIFVLDDIS